MHPVGTRVFGAHKGMAVLIAAAALKFTTRRLPAQLVAPAARTPREMKLLSDIDDQDALRLHVPAIQLYRRREASSVADPAPVIRDAVARALVHYYPLAGRIRELDGRKLAVDCTGEGVLFVEADADVRLDHFGVAVHPPLPCLEELLFDVPGSSDMLNSPLLLMQVTRLACGGFVVAVRVHHAMADAQGILQFLQAVAELARGAAAPTVQPVWDRHLLMARNPPRPSFPHHEYDQVPWPYHKGTTVVPAPADAMVQRFFFFGQRELAAIKADLPPRLQTKRTTTFEALTGFLWKYRAMALAPDDADEEMRLICVVSARRRGANNDGLVIPEGYYGNSFAFPVAIATTSQLCANPVSYAVELVKKAKGVVDAAYLQSVADLMVLRGRPSSSPGDAYVVCDLTKFGLGLAGIDYGWGKPVYGGVASLGPIPGLPSSTSLFVQLTNAKGEDGIVVPMCLPGFAMDRFVEEMGKLMRPSAADDVVSVPQQQGVYPAKKSAL